VSLKLSLEQAKSPAERQPVAVVKGTSGFELKNMQIAHEFIHE
jgi:hypothetical protein